MPETNNQNFFLCTTLRSTTSTTTARNKPSSIQMYIHHKTLRLHYNLIKDSFFQCYVKSRETKIDDDYDRARVENFQNHPSWDLFNKFVFPNAASSDKIWTRRKFMRLIKASDCATAPVHGQKSLRS